MKIEFGRYGRAYVRLWPSPSVSVGRYYDFGLSRHSRVVRRDDGSFYEAASQRVLMLGKWRFPLAPMRETGLS